MAEKRLAPIPVKNPPCTYDRTLNIGMIGDSAVNVHSIGDTVRAFALADRFDINCYSFVKNNYGTDQEYQISDITTRTSSGLGLFGNVGSNENMLKCCLSKPGLRFDYFIFGVGRGSVLLDEEAAEKTLASAKYISGLIRARSPGCRFILLEPPAYDGRGALSKKLGIAEKTEREQNALISAFSARMDKAVGGAETTVCVGKAFEYFAEKYADSGISLYDRSGDFQSDAGSFFTAALIYASVFRKTPVGDGLCGIIDFESAALLQKAAHGFVFGTPLNRAFHLGAPLPGISFEEIDPRTQKKRDPRFENEVYPEYYGELFAAAYSIFARGRFVQYDKTSLAHELRTFFRRDITKVPEYAAPQSTFFLDCSAFCYVLYKEVFGYKTRGSDTASMIDTEECSAYYWNGADSDVSREDAVKSFFAALRPGDVIIQRAQTGGHALLYIGNGMILHCTNTHAGHDAHDYNYTAKHDAPELFGGIMLSPVDILTDPSSIYFTFSPKYRVRLLRPLMLGVKPTDTAALRAKNLSGVITFKTCTAFDAKTVSKGEDVSFTYVLRNDTKTARTVTVGDRLPEGLKYRSGDVDLTDGGFEADVEIPANSSVSFSYTATVTAENGTLIPCDETLFGGVPANATPFKVGNTLKLPFDAIVAAAGTASGASDIDCINAIYEKTVGAATPIRSAEELMSSSFVFNENLIGSVSSPMLISEYHFGGTAVSCMIEGNTKRIRELTVSEFVPGDLLAILTEESKMRFMLFAGRGRLISFESGSPVLLSAADSAERISSVFAERAFMVLRPSLLM